MNTSAFVETGEFRRFDVKRGSVLRVRSGGIWLTQNDGKDYLTRAGGVVDLTGQGPVLVTALEPSLLELHRADAGAVRARIEREASRARATRIWAFLRRLVTRTKDF
jgi:hypothetical protein